MMHPDAPRLFALDGALHTEAQEMLAASGIGAILADAGYRAVGSFAMRTMVWRAHELERPAEPDWRKHWETGARLAETGWCVRLQCVDVYREQWQDYGLYWGLRVADPERKRVAPPGDPEVWKMDLWTARPGEFAPMAPRRKVWAAALTEEARSHVLAIKNAVHAEPEYRKTLLSVHIYEAVLERGIRDLDEFRRWWQAAYAGKEGESP